MIAARINTNTTVRTAMKKLDREWPRLQTCHLFQEFNSWIS
jgi:hypothetical protein